MKNTLIVIPTYNEAENIEAIVRQLLSIDTSYHVVVVDDSSPDGTGSIVKAVISEYPDRIFLETRPKKEGLGRAYLHAFKWALLKGYNYIFEIDADFSHNPNDIPRMQERLIKGADVVIGSRYIDGINVINWPLGRILLSLGASYYVKFFTGLPVKDPTAGFVGYKAEVLNAIDLDSVKFVGYAFQIELKYKAWIKGFNLQEVSIIFLNRAKGQSKMNGSIIWEAIYGVVYLRIKSLFKYKS
ncbi:polyprenol monophosphomannose synthase [Flavobacteriaceae bacterium]|jgi:dolichol-phosphate mannosyltransferase|uniref:polyprenol monophosphomannose synthase n=1 Tax=Candidatus Arcticimaribacter forsetii TaxID=2820661 RepID=UPI002076F4B7|nr:polyprenol monophosphomannose synthase [Candidatus Arcticimaribacter forsetii]MCH1538979.1 polyprenol monophosphomannose synthase [Flavobacteriaceae bacterium]MDA8698722.1 polyprenol monophosphomannose synthase [Flavobacteriaceae bacterium]MDB2325689.1 polyprenol monophosphomannose synthase [Flavobacteriaceae bacterium]MDB2329224.1 polyprenol monophosphomannose synthase [Flavobacteriaceae bacterium]MDB2345850.1 polyprenol monophosphomannose synthase [Flavobacteriaceae bacterium]